MTDRDVTIFEVGPRDGLQNEKTPVSTMDKVRLVDLLSDAGCPIVEAASFVSPRWVPQMADGAEVMAGIARHPGTRYAVLTPNLKGFDRALAARSDIVAIFGSASEGFSQKNINCSIEESFARFQPVADAAQDAGIPVRGYVSVVVECPYDGPIAPAQVARVSERLMAMGCYEISLGDTIGRGTPETVDAMLAAVLQAVPAEKLAAHFHDTNGRAKETLAVALDRGVRVIDSAVTGLGGCPYAPGAKGNVATETVLDLLDERGLAHGIDRGKLALAADHIRGLLTPAGAGTE